MVFDLEPIKEFNLSNNEETILIYSGKIKEYMNLGKNVCEASWINENTIDKYDFIDGEKEILLDYFKSNK